MEIEVLQQNWGLAVALSVFFVVAVFVTVTLVRRSAWGQLKRTLSDLKSSTTKRQIAFSASHRAEKALAALQKRADNAKPRLLREAEELLQDTRALSKIAADQVLIAKNRVRRVIYEEYPPRRHEQLRRKHLADDEQDEKPFSF